MTTAHAHAKTLADAVARAGGPRLRASGTRVYFPGGDYVTVGARGSVSSASQRGPTFTEASLAPTWRRGWQEGLHAYLETLSQSARAQNPVSVGTIRAALNLATKLAGRKKPSVVSAKEYAKAVQIAERELHETTEDALYGCGDFGCAAPLEGRDGLLKVTTDREEEMVVAAIVRAQAFEGFARIWKGPVLLSAETGMVWRWYAYTREVVLVTERQMPYGTWNILRALDDARERADEPEYLRGIMRLWTFAKKHPSMLGIARTMRVLWRDGYMLGDFHSGNYGERDGSFVLFDAKASLRAPRARRSNPTGKPKRARKPLPEGVSDWYSVYAEKGAPRAGEKRYVETITDQLPYPLRAVIARAIELWRDPEAGPYIAHTMAREGYFPEEYVGDTDEPMDDWGPEDIAALLGVDSSEDALAILLAVSSGLSDAPDEPGIVPEFIEVAVVGDALLAADPERAKRPRLVLVSKDFAREFTEKHHQHYPEMKDVGLMYTVGVAVGPRVVAVATAGTPSGGFRSRACPFDGILELSRVASDGSVLGASSMLASRILDLTPKSGRRGLDGCLFVTYSLFEEAGTTYLALADKGLRPVGIRPESVTSGQRRGKEGPKRVPPKIIWEAGVAALPPDWSVLEKTEAKSEQIRGAMGAFYAWDQRERKEGRGTKLALPKKSRRGAR